MNEAFYIIVAILLGMVAGAKLAFIGWDHTISELEALKRDKNDT